MIVTSNLGGVDAESIHTRPDDKLRIQARAILAHAVAAHRDGLRVYESLRNLNQVVGTEYGDRVLYELIQNAHDAHAPDDRGRIAVRLTVRTDTDGTLYVANGGNSFRWKDVDAIQNLATTAKEVGEGIGNKGLGFRSIEALTDNVRIYSRRPGSRSTRFDGYCFRFAGVAEIENLLRAEGVNATIAREVAGTVPRYLVPVPLAEPPPDVTRYAELGYASVIVAPLRTPEAIALAQRQVQALADLDEVPLLLFLHRIAEFRIDAQTPDGKNYARRLSRRQTLIGDVPGIEGCRMYEVHVGQNRRFLVVRRDVDKSRVLQAVRHSLSQASEIKRWLDWKGQPSVSVAVGLSSDTIIDGRLYNFLPMGDTATAPLLGHLDAPFFAHIDRRNANFDLPLNATLMAAAAEACARAALHLAGRADPPVPKRAVFDLVAWTGEHARGLDQALADADSSLQNAPLVPSIPIDGAGWTSLMEVFTWPDGAFSLMKATAVARRTGARLVSSDLDRRRLARLKAMADREYLPLSPSGDHLADWAERFAASLARGNAAAITWRRFYDDLNRLFHAAGESLDSLAGWRIILDRGRRLRQAGGHDHGSGIGAFVRSESSRRRRAKDGVPLPPSSLTRRYRFLHENIKLPPETLNAFVQAGLVREYDPVDALAGLAAVLGDRANDNRRLEALTWAFRVWRTAGTGIRDTLLGAGLWVPTAGGWRPATRAAFPASWTAIGRTLENFLVEASSASPDCRRSRDALLVEFGAWPEVRDGTRRQWVEFLTLLGVTDGLRPVAGQLMQTGQGSSWDQLRRNGEARGALDRAWCAAASHVSFRHPYTTYSRKGEAWRLPGQIEYDGLSDAAKQAFHQLAFKHLAERGAECLTFDVGRFDRGPHYHDRQTLPSPLAAFLRSRAWIAVDTRDEPRFHRAGDCWAARTRQGRPPRFIARLADADATLVEGTEEFADLVFSEVLGVSDWEAGNTAVRRLRALAGVATDLAPHDRREFHREYRRAWKDLVDQEAPLPADLELVVNRGQRLEVLPGNDTAPPSVIVAPNAHAFDARILVSAGHALLDIGDAPANGVAERLAATERFAPRRLDGVGVQLLVDGDPFVPTTSDPLLISLGLGWLPEVVVLGHELLADGLELRVLRTTVERRIRAIRVRQCRSIALVVDGQVVTPSEEMAFYGVEHDELPTLILADGLQLTRSSLAWELSRTVSRMVDRRLRYLEPLLHHLARGQAGASLDAPADQILARALGCDPSVLDEYRAALRTDLGHVLHLLAPVVAYLANIVLARELITAADQAGAAFDVGQWLQSRLPYTKPAPNELLTACERAADRAALRRQLNLDYARFNLVLQALDEPPLSNEAELRSVYRGYLDRIRSKILERLRRRYAADYRNGRDLVHYVARKSLDFLPFDDDWILTRETLDQGVVDAHVSRLLDDALGADKPADLPPWRGLLERNRRTVRDFAADAAAVLAAWCRRNGAQSLEPWQSDDPQALARHLENAGLLDFEVVTTVDLPQLCRRSCCWPSRMPPTLDRATLELDQAAIQSEERRRERERRRRIVEQRSIEFSGTTLDTGIPGFAEAFRKLAEEGIAADPGWYERSRQRPRLAAVTQPSGGSSGGGNGGGSGRPRRPNEAQRLAMGLASEWLAFQFLQRRHGDFVTEDCWVSSNRAQFFGGGDGDDAAGYDFRLSTPRVEWLYEVKSAIEDTGEFELTPNEMRVAASASKDVRHRYRILYVPFVFSPDRWFVLELPNPMGDTTRNRFRQVGQGSIRFRFEHSANPPRT
ncbi:MAG: DUF3883 domain-containing protein [Gammaproteobacteria bacterium]|nr:DUF3883 domain-containing protein [Gammaproteobacteria bacterium]